MNKKISFLKPVITIILCIFVIWFLLKIDKSSIKEDPIENQKIYQPVGSLWNTYTNSKYNFSFEYPPDLTSISTDESRDGKEFSVLISNNSYPELSVVVYKDDKNIDPKDFITNLIESTYPNPEAKAKSNIIFSEIEISGHKALNVKHYDWFMDENTNTIYVFKNNLIYEIDALHDHLPLELTSGGPDSEHEGKIKRSDFLDMVVKSFSFSD